jgi:hypothetical protein
MLGLAYRQSTRLMRPPMDFTFETQRPQLHHIQKLCFCPFDIPLDSICALGDANISGICIPVRFLGVRVAFTGYVPSQFSIMTLRRTPLRSTSWYSLVSKAFYRSASLNCSRTFVSSQAPEEDIENNRELFEYTSGRWMYVEIWWFAQYFN